MKFGTGTVLFLIFLTLKLTGVIAWSWWFVTMPLWIVPLLVVAFSGLVVGIGILSALIKD